jgi:hypothetical protein
MLPDVGTKSIGLYIVIPVKFEKEQPTPLAL